MRRQHSTPILLSGNPRRSASLVPLAQSSEASGVSEADIQRLVHEHPETLPIAEIDPVFSGAISVCRELNTPAGAIDNFLITASALPVLVECKLWLNPQGRREVVGQILDYAKELSRWSSSDLTREVSRRLKRSNNPLLETVRAVAPDVDEIQFNDALTVNLRRGRFLLLIVGDGIREGVEAIAEYMQGHAGLHFSLGLVEMPIYLLPDGQRLVAPRVLARTVNIVRQVVELPAGYELRDLEGDDTASAASPAQLALSGDRQRFWKEFLDGLILDDPEQPIPAPAKLGYLSFMLPAPAGSSWLTVYRDKRHNTVGVFLSASRNSAGEYAMYRVAEDWSTVRFELGGSVRLGDHDGRPRIVDTFGPVDLDVAEPRQRAMKWLRERTNSFVNVMRPRVRSAAADYHNTRES